MERHTWKPLRSLQFRLPRGHVTDISPGEALTWLSYMAIAAVAFACCAGMWRVNSWSAPSANRAVGERSMLNGGGL